MEENIVEKWTREYHEQGLEGHAAARQLCRDLGCHGHMPHLKKMLEKLLADANTASHDHAVTRSTLREVVSSIPKN
jgi:hypothetical protein